MTLINKRLAIVGSVGAACFLLACLCGSMGSATSPNGESSEVEATTMDAYKMSLNLDLPAEASNFQIESDNLSLGFTSDAYFTYQAGPAYFDRLQRHTLFMTPSDLNESIRLTDCAASGFPKDFSYWTAKEIDLTDKVCYTGTFYPYVHYLVYDEATQHVDHFVAGVRD